MKIILWIVGAVVVVGALLLLKGKQTDNPSVSPSVSVRPSVSVTVTALPTDTPSETDDVVPDGK